MAYLIKVGNTFNIPVGEYCCDTNEEFEEKLKNDLSISVGSRVYIIDSGKVMIKNTNSWSQISNGGNSDTNLRNQIAFLQETVESLNQQIVSLTEENQRLETTILELMEE